MTQGIPDIAIATYESTPCPICETESVYVTYFAPSGYPHVAYCAGCNGIRGEVPDGQKLHAL